MASKIQTLIQQAKITFDGAATKPVGDLKRDIIALKNLANTVTVKDINVLKKKLSTGILQKTPPVDYVELFEDTDVSIGVFILRRGAKLPLHDHPGMHGVLKILHGTISVKSYTVISPLEETTPELANSKFFFKFPLKVKTHDEVLYENNSDCCILTPVDQNIHEVKCIEGPAAFLDVLSPPYEEDGIEKARSCHYFKILDDKENFSIIRQVHNTE